MKTERIITIGRQFGSGGREVGIKLAEKLEIPVYDKELLERAARESGLSEAVIKTYDEKPRSLLFTAATDPYAFGMMSAGIDESVENRAENRKRGTLYHHRKRGGLFCEKSGKLPESIYLRAYGGQDPYDHGAGKSAGGQGEKTDHSD